MKRKLAFLGAILLAAFIFTYEGNTYQTHALDEEDQAWIEEARGALQNIVEDREVMALVYLCDDLTIRAEAAEDSTKVVTVPSGQMVEIRDVTMDEDYQVWEKVSAEVKGKVYEGYIPRDYLACSDERFLEWEELYGMNPGAEVMLAEENATGVYADIEQFPESYRPALQALKQKHPNWTFVRQNTGLDFQTAVNNELQGGKSLVYKSYGDYCKEGQHSPNWYFASEDVLKLYMDPRNSLQENAIFQFEQLTYNASYHTEEAVKNFLEGTFMNSSQNAPETSMKFYHIFWSIGAEENRQVSPFHLAARVLQEQGEGTSPLISGTYPGYEHYYNYFNVGASGSTNEEVIRNGLNYAKDHDWHGAYYSILGGAEVISASYIRKGQDTLYLQKFNVSPTASNPVYTHQYMQNISAPTSEALSMKKLYESAGALENTFVFKIPVYENMPASPCPMPTSSTNVVLQVPSGYDASTIYVDGIAYTPQVRNNRRIVKLPNGNAQSAVVYRYNENGAPIGMYVWTLEYRNNAYVATEQPGLTDLLTYHGFSIRITGKAGIRFKTGISTDLRAQLLGNGVNGYHLKEYGTLVMNNANRTSYPMIKGGEKVISGLAYGTNANGTYQDSIYETVSGRYRFTSVLVGLPANQYKVEYAFRGYIILNKDGKDITIYGPVQARSIYALAQQVLNMGTYAQGSEADAFLRKLNAGEKVIAIELDSPRNADLTGYLEGAKKLQAAGADLLTIADCPIAQARMDSSLVACRVHRELGLCTLPHMTCRDRNLNATKALLLGLYAEGVREVLAITGDPIPTAERDEVKNVYQFNSRKLAQYIVSLAGEGREMPSPLTVFGALNLNARNFDVELRRAQEKLQNGMSGFLTQPVLSAQAVVNLKKTREILGEKAKILAGIMPVVSQRNAIFMENEVNGIHVDAEIIERFAGLDRAQGEELGLEVSVKAAQAAAPYADGFYLMTPFNRIALMERLIARLKDEGIAD
mgnify:CR=1 FL=1